MEDTLPPGFTRVKHEFEPVYNNDSKILILGSFPSVKSRENNFYYGHSQNRFWKLMAQLLHAPVPVTIEEKKALLLEHGIALWDVVSECDIHGSSDLSIRNVIPANINQVLRSADIELIIANGATAFKLYQKYCQEHTGREAVKCPSTSPANAVFTLERLAESWGEVIAPFLS
ncbi:MAG: DNA-deoxyinosine glycosylase [Lachnospiraceae bacterium]|nr:DNA-deoxyinosine glycosylase [Lachnospiraceae bacterium]